MAEVMIFTTIDRILWGVAISLTFICALQYLKQGKKNDSVDDKLISFGYSYLFFGITLSTVFLLLSELQIPGAYTNHTFYGNYNEVSPTYEVLLKCAWVIGISDYIIFFYAFERIVKKTKYLITISNIIFIVLLIILPFNLAVAMVWLFSYELIFLTILLLYTKWSRLEHKAVSAFMLLGSVLITIGVGFNSQPSKELNITPLIIAPIFFILGTTFCLAPTIINPKYFTSGLKYWKIIGVGVIGLLCGVEFIFIFYLFIPLYVVIVLVLLLFVIFSLFFVFKSIKTQTISEDVEEIKDFLGAFTKPEKITEEEVSISKEKKICLVCKGKVGGIMFMCKECGAFYCAKCSNALSDLENACWACGEPFDESKPSKPYKKEEEIQVETSEKPQKKPKIKK